MENFLYNVANNLRDQGYFIGTMLDGDKIETLFENAGTGKLRILYR